MTTTYGFETTTDELLRGRDLTGIRALITGASAGLGAETARALAAHGAHVIMTARDLGKGQRAAGTVRAGAAPGATVELRELDLASLASVRACADHLLAEGRPLHILFANAGVMACPESKTADGFETQFGTNHLGHFLFVNKLVPLLLKGADNPSGPSRIVCLSSSGHRFSDVSLDDPNFETTPYDPWTAYGRSKTANALFALALDNRLKDRGVRAIAVHPGGIRTELGRHMTPDVLQQMLHRVKNQPGNYKFKTVPQGAATSIWAALIADPDEAGGRFCEDCHVAETISDPDVMSGVRPYAQDPAHAEDLWAKSEELVGERFPLA
jgi:NAD(P)-dependent dehydrogenase (short-subunit alcohol dehydrogenase family)